MASFKELEVYQRSVRLVKFICDLTHAYPDEEKYGLVTQIRRAAVGIPSNIAEGASRRTAKDRQYFIDIALGSLNEVYAQMLLSNELGYITGTTVGRFESGYEVLRPKLIAYQRSIHSRPT